MTKATAEDLLHHFTGRPNVKLLNQLTRTMPQAEQARVPQDQKTVWNADLAPLPILDI